MRQMVMLEDVVERASVTERLVDSFGIVPDQILHETVVEVWQAG